MAEVGNGDDDGNDELYVIRKRFSLKPLPKRRSLGRIVNPNALANFKFSLLGEQFWKNVNSSISKALLPTVVSPWK